jgi:hypothetical protein
MEYYVDFCGYCKINADNEQQANTEFWRLITEVGSVPQAQYEIQGIEAQEVRKTLDLDIFVSKSEVNQILERFNWTKSTVNKDTNTVDLVIPVAEEKIFDFIFGEYL